MKRSTRCEVCILLLVCLALGVPAGSQANEAPGSPYRIHELENGLKILIKPDKAAPVVAINVWIKVGSRNEQAGQEGFSHLIEHMMFKGTEKHPVGTLDAEIKKLGVTQNAFTSHDYTCYYLVGARQHFQKLMELEADAVLGSSFHPEELAKETQVVLEELRMGKDDPQRKLYQLTQETVFKVHPYKHPVVGYEQGLASATRDQIYGFYKQHYVPSNMWVVIVGDVEPDTALEVVRGCMGAAPRVEPPAQNIPEEPAQKMRREAVLFADVQQTRLNLAWRAPGIRNPDNVVLDVIARIIGSGRSSRLHKTLVEKEKLAHDVKAQYYTALDPYMILVNATIDQSKVRHFVSRCTAIMKELTRTEIPEDELEKAKQQLIAETIFAAETAESQAFRLGHYAVLSTVEEGEAYVSQVREVRPEDVRRVAAETFVDTALSVCSVQPSIPAPDVKPEMLTLANGLKLILKENHASPIVALTIQIDAGGLREGAKEAGLANLVAKTLLKGTERKSADDIASAFEAMGTSVSCAAFKSFVTIKMKCLSENFLPSLTLLLNILENADFPADEVKRERDLALQALKTQDDDLFTFTYYKALEQIYPDTPLAYPNQGIEGTLSRLEQADARRFFKDYYHAGGMVVSIVGNFFGREIRQTLENKFGGIRSGKTKKGEDWKIPERKQKIEVNSQKNRNQAQILVARRTFPRPDPRTPALDVLCGILSGSMSSRLFVTLRGKDALAYSVWAGSVGFMNDGLFYATLSTEAGKAERAQVRLWEELEGLRLRGFSAQELQDAKDYLVGQYALKMVDNLALADIFSSDEFFGLGHDYYLKYPGVVASISADDVANVAMQLLVASEGYVVSVTKP